MAAAIGPVLFGYDGSALAAQAIEEAGRQLAPGREALVVCVWQPADVGFTPVGDQHFDAQCASEVHAAAEAVAAAGAELAGQAGFAARGVTVEAAPTWKGIVEAAHEHGASLVVMGTHRRSGILGHLLGSVTHAVDAHFEGPVLVVHQRG
jgi:nucleotide-binding universal stress UspA family protein